MKASELKVAEEKASLIKASKIETEIETQDALKWCWIHLTGQVPSNSS